MKRIGIIGAGRFGMSLAESLSNAGAEVLLIDRNRPAMQMANEFSTAVQGDATTSHSPKPASSSTCGCVASPCTAVENSLAICMAGLLRSMSSTSAPAFESDSASDMPKRPAPIIPIRFMS